MLSMSHLQIFNQLLVTYFNLFFLFLTFICFMSKGASMPYCCTFPEKSLAFKQFCGCNNVVTEVRLQSFMVMKIHYLLGCNKVQ